MLNPIPFVLGMVGLTALSGPVSGQLNGDPVRGEQSAMACVACHQADGSGMHVEGGDSWPRLAGLDAGYIARQLSNFKSGARSNALMEPFANMLDDRQIADVAAFYSQMEPTHGQGGGNADDALLARGETLARRGDWSIYLVACSSCHGPENQGVGTVFPGIAGQHAGYIESQLQAWRNGTRKNDPQDLMGSIARRMNDEDIRAVAAWLSNQTPGTGTAGTSP